MEFLSVARKQYPGTKMIVVSSKGDVGTVVEAMQSGALDFIRKPLDVDEIQIAVNNAIHLKEIEEDLERRKRKNSFKDEIPFLYVSREMASIMEVVQQAAPTKVPVLITGESGVGKEVIAREIHHRSERSGGPFVKVNCAALPATLLESELFGFEKGAFTGAVASKEAKFEKASTGTIFLDEIGELDPGIQAKFLHVLQDGTFNRLGSNKSFKSDARVIVATNSDLEQAIANGTFRSDLFFRLNVIRIHVPELRERKTDIPMLAEHFMEMCNRKFHKTMEIGSEMMEKLVNYEWPGNVRELQNAISRYAVLGKLALGRQLIGSSGAMAISGPGSGVVSRPVSVTGSMADSQTEKSLPDDITHIPMENDEPDDITLVPKSRPLREIAKEAARKAEREVILRTLEMTRWNKAKTARILNISYKALLYKIKDCGIEQASVSG
jgi:two-component system response regulator AtoC